MANKSDSVDVAFELMLLELETKIEDLNEQGAASFRNSDYADAKSKADTGTKLGEFKKKIEALRQEWQSHHAETFPSTGADAINRIYREISESTTKSAKTVLVVRFPDGSTIFEKFAADSFAKTIQKIGFSRVGALHHQVNGDPLVSLKPSTKYNSTEIDGYYVMTHSSTAQKKEHLDKISKALGLGLVISVVPGA